MKYSPLAVHCTSLCFDVIQSSSFKTLSHQDIDGFREDIYTLISERAFMQPMKYPREHEFIIYVTNGVLTILHQCLAYPNARDSQWILTSLESRIELSIKTILH